MRIIAGAHKGARLTSPSGANTRPTSDRVKESLFSMLDGYGVVPAANVLDLFAGSGGLGFEAMSRGAAQVDFVDSSLASIRSLQANADKLGLDHSATVHAGDVLQFLAGLPGPENPESRVFDLVFMDPPYPLGEDAVTQILRRLRTHLDMESIVVVERAARSPEPTMPDGLEVFRAKTFGETAIHFVQLAGEADDAAAAAD
ncbi:16S rRNA (guanine(966)-N(2))-methyltransferase RsmD [Brevibacterium linens]|uniref:16S rRNA (guanine(966)-N(2))-methyltransferase RsmD n=1 Tax=Brevibacterium linens TaxID=1703 RepID=UPI000FCA248A|nr:16S rRNA (guanine(966)-N(2))-methyltransferase RsmD [Brevibacterium linens]AZU01294.1 16S rRNA (guanine(966)-N(2))-methyltransferase RsmD [Brevibacterium linens]